MTISTYIAIYLGCGFLLLAWGAFADLNTGQRATFWTCLLWPITLFVLVPLVLVTDAIARRGWRANVEFRRDLSFRGFRRPNNAAVTGWAIRFAWVELQVWKRAAP